MARPRHPDYPLTRTQVKLARRHLGIAAALSLRNETSDGIRRLLDYAERMGLTAKDLETK